MSQTYEVRPGAQLVEERVARALGTHELAVAEQLVVGPQEASAHRAPGKRVAHRTHRGFGRQLRGVVAHEGHAKAAAIVVSSVRAYPVPASALVHVAV